MGNSNCRWTAIYHERNQIAFSPDGGYFAEADGGRVRVWDFPLREHFIELHWEGVAYTVAFSPNSKLVACGGREIFVATVDPEGPRFRAKTPKPGSRLRVTCIAFSPNGKQIAVVYGGDDNPPVELWTIPDMK